jgi:ElaB/YqjD/DUF883 family membrane-anchored ribosome-binding protein
MSRTNEKHTTDGEDTDNRFASDLASLQNSFEQLREDVGKLLGGAVNAVKSGAGAIKSQAAGAVSDIRDRGNESLDRVGKQIGRNPMLSAGIAFGVGFIVAKRFFWR